MKCFISAARDISSGSRSSADGWMVAITYGASGGRNELAPLLRDAESAAEQRLGRRSSQAYEHERADELDFLPEPWAAGVDLRRSRTPMEPALPAWLPFEVLHRVRHVRVAAFDARGLECAIEQPPGGPHERSPSPVFLIAGDLAYEHDARLARTLAENRLRRRLPQQAAATTRRRGARGAQ